MEQRCGVFKRVYLAFRLADGCAAVVGELDGVGAFLLAQVRQVIAQHCFLLLAAVVLLLFCFWRDLRRLLDARHAKIDFGARQADLLAALDVDRLVVGCWCIATFFVFVVVLQ